MESKILAQVVRGETVESIHRGHLIVVDGDGETLYSLGNPATVTFWRSSAKAFQAIPFLESGAADEFGYTADEIALACGSHSGERMHTKTAARMLGKIELNEKDLRCGAHLPFDEKRAAEMIHAGETPTQLHNNCSGKHAAMLAFCVKTNADIKTYEQLEHPLQKAILETVARFTDVPVEAIKIGIDGCAAPNFAVPVSAMAKAFARLVNPPENHDEAMKNACREIVAAMLEYPEMIGGTDRLDTMLMREGNGNVISKIGAEGVYSAGVLPCEQYPKGLGIALKIEDGDDKRARAVVLIELLRQLGIFKTETLKEFSPLPIKNRRGDWVGETRANFNINDGTK